jgi:hypothetical protein
MSGNGNDLVIQVLFDELRLIVCHEGRSGDLPLTQATITQMADQRRALIADTFTITHLPDKD